MNIINKFDWKLALLILVLISAESFAQLFLEKASLIEYIKYKKSLYLILGIILYSIVGFVYYLALNTDMPLAIVNVIWQASTIIIITLISMFYFKQKISIKQIIGIIIVAIGSIFFIPTQQATIGGQAIGGSDAQINSRKDMLRYLRAIEKRDI